MSIITWTPGRSHPVGRLVGALLAAIVLVASAIWLLWQPEAGPTTSGGLDLLILGGDVDWADGPARTLFLSMLLLTVLVLLGYAWVDVRKRLVRFVDEHREAMRTVSDTESMNMALLGALPDTIFLSDRNGRFIKMRDRDSSGRVAATHIEGSTLHDAYPDDVADRILRTLRSVTDAGEMQTLEYALDESGSIRHYEVRATAYGKDRALVIVRDVTDRADAERSIREAESKFRILVEQSLAGIYIIQDGRFVYVNPRFAEVFGYTPEELLALDSVRDVLVPEDRGALCEHPVEGLQGSEDTPFTIRGIRKDSTILCAEVFRSIIDYNGRPAITGTLLDVTEQREAQEQLRVLGMAVEQSAEGVLVIDTAGIVCFVNPAWARMHGYTASEVTGHHFRIFHTQEQLRREVFPVINRFEKTSIYRAEMGRKRKDGSTFMSSTAFASLRDDDGRVIGAVGICRDITEQKQYEAELLAAKERAEELSRVKSAFLTNMSHEIRTPLTGILGFAKILEDELPSDQQEFARLIQVSGDRLMNTLNSIMDLARLEAGEIELAVHDVDLTEEVMDAVTVFRAIARDKRLEFDLYLDHGDMPARVDRNMLGIVLNNLMANAVKFTKKGRISVELEADDELVSISVTDTGVGIDADFLPHLFDEFKQESDGLARSHEGSGLGLSITRRVVEMMGGTIHAESAKGKGSRFVVVFPRYVDRPVLLEAAPPSTISRLAHRMAR